MNYLQRETTKTDIAELCSPLKWKKWNESLSCIFCFWKKTITFILFGVVCSIFYFSGPSLVSSSPPEEGGCCYALFLALSHNEISSSNRFIVIGLRLLSIPYSVYWPWWKIRKMYRESSRIKEEAPFVIAFFIWLNSTKKIEEEE